MDFANERELVQNAISDLKARKLLPDASESLPCCGRSLSAHYDDHIEGLVALRQLMDGDEAPFVDYIAVRPLKRFSGAIMDIWRFNETVPDSEKSQLCKDLHRKIGTAFPDVLAQFGIPADPNAEPDMLDGLPPEIRQLLESMGGGDANVSMQVIRIPIGGGGSGLLEALLGGLMSEDDNADEDPPLWHDPSSDWLN